MNSKNSKSLFYDYAFFTEEVSIAEQKLFSGGYRIKSENAILKTLICVLGK